MSFLGFASNILIYRINCTMFSWSLHAWVKWNVLHTRVFNVPTTLVNPVQVIELVQMTGQVDVGLSLPWLFFEVFGLDPTSTLTYKK